MRRGFTLIELLISIILFSLIATFLYAGIDQVRIMRLFYAQKGEVLKKHERIRSLLYRDLIQADVMIIGGNEDYSMISLSGEKNSLYNIVLPSVIWLVMDKDKSVLRLESAQNIQLPLRPSDLYKIHSDVVVSQCSSFHVYETNVSRFASLNCDNQEIQVETPR